MFKRFPKILLLCAVSLCSFATFHAQPSKPNAEFLQAGETLIYEGKLRTPGFPLVTSVADLTFTLEKTTDDKRYLIKTDAKSKGTLTGLFGVKFRQQFESTAASSFRVYKTVKRDVQGDRVRNSEAVFDYSEKKVTYIETDPENPMRAPRRIASGIAPETFDLVSAIYAMRFVPLAVGKNFDLTVSDSGLVYKIPVRVTAREQIDSALGKKWCFRLEPEVFGANRVIDQKGSLLIWIVDDERRTPVRARIETKIGKIDGKIQINLKKVENRADKSEATASKK